MALEFSVQTYKLPLHLRLLKMLIATISKFAPQYVARYGFDMFITPKRRPFTDKQRSFLETGERFSIPFQSYDLVAYRWGAGKRVLLVHGWESNSAVMEYFVNPLVNAGYEVIALDCPAHGNSSGKQVDLLQYGESILCTINYLGGVHALIAHSIGATASAVVLGTHMHYTIQKTVLISPIDRMTNIFALYANGLGLNTNVQDAIYNILEKRFGHPPQYYSNPDLLEHYPHPMLIVHDKDDRVVPFSWGQAIGEKVKSARVLVTNGLGHRRILKDDKTIEHIIGFVKER